MSKHRKTRQEKIIADLRNQLIKTQNTEISSQSPTVSLKSLNIPQVKPAILTQSQSITLDNYLSGDLNKTAILTLFIIALEMALFFLFRQKAIVLPMLQFLGIEGR